jgi:hypothetical protein
MNSFYRSNMSPWEIIRETASVIKTNWCKEEETQRVASESPDARKITVKELHPTVWPSEILDEIRH